MAVTILCSDKVIKKLQMLMDSIFALNKFSVRYGGPAQRLRRKGKPNRPNAFVYTPCCLSLRPFVLQVSSAGTLVKATTTTLHRKHSLFVDPKMGSLKVYIDLMSQPSRAIMLLLKVNKISVVTELIDISKGEVRYLFVYVITLK